MLNTTEIQRLLPHRYPFLFVDEIREIEIGKRIVGIKNVTLNEPYFQGHFPGRPIMPGVLIVEALAQTGGVLLLSEEKNRGKFVYFVGIDNVKFRKPVIPKCQLRLEVWPLKIRRTMGKMRGVAYVGDDLVAEAEMMFAMSEK
ncbi:MAG: 3-hydroxyacyl-ACP dehydratase FabZ [bacterium]|nr:3-hydroxyacyl-ACP dehydratase FabZ [bacterium]